MGTRADIYFEDLEKEESKDWSYDENPARQLAVSILEKLDVIFSHKLFDKNNKWFECEDAITKILQKKIKEDK
jgi:hypothetical protein